LPVPVPTCSPIPPLAGDGAGRCRFAFAPYRLSGVVYGTLLNARAALAALGDAVHQPPYKAPPLAPVLYLKPRNTLLASGEPVVVPAGVAALEVGASLGLVVGRPACRVAVTEAGRFIAGYTLVLDFSVPHADFYRPSVRLKALDGSCLVGPGVVPGATIADPDALALELRIDDRLAQQASTAGMLRPVARLLAEVTEFMTLMPGDVLMLGVPAAAPLAGPGSRVVATLEGVGRLQVELVARAVGGLA
jgi:5-oxopent-3-ene-1,2,5-tricarboxylate decarboxylase / 2-hydroxyhepta-2,4-diene-1,7-dioate isomerase